MKLSPQMSKVGALLYSGVSIEWTGERDPDQDAVDGR